MAKHNEEEDPRIEDFVQPRIDKGRRTGRRSITLWINNDIIQACQPHPGTILREWIENNFRKKA
jgi:hypothetical protein